MGGGGGEGCRSKGDPESPLYELKSNWGHRNIWGNGNYIESRLFHLLNIPYYELKHFSCQYCVKP